MVTEHGGSSRPSSARSGPIPSCIPLKHAFRQKPVKRQRDKAVPVPVERPGACRPCHRPVRRSWSNMRTRPVLRTPTFRQAGVPPISFRLMNHPSQVWAAQSLTQISVRSAARQNRRKLRVFPHAAGTKGRQSDAGAGANLRAARLLDEPGHHRRPTRLCPTRLSEVAWLLKRPARWYDCH